jgi:pyroglutamyl-peptidase
MAEKPKILITGFSHFPGAPENPTEVLVGLCKQHISDLSVCAEIEARLLPTEYHHIDAHFSKIMEEANPDIALHFGLKAQAKGFTLEQMARNKCKAERVDASGRAPKSPEIDPQGPAMLASNLPLDDMRRALKKANLPVEMSDDAGGYVCNYLFYCARRRAMTGREILSGFIHVPLLETQTDDKNLMTLTEDELWRGTREIVMTCAKLW